MATEKRPWLNKYTASVAAGLTVAAMTGVVGARFFPDAFAAFTASLSSAAAYLAEPVTVARWLWWLLIAIAGAVLIAIALVLVLTLTTRSNTVAEPAARTTLIEGVLWHWTAFAGEVNALVPICPRPGCNNELDMYSTTAATNWQQKWPPEVTEFSCNRCSFRTVVGFAPREITPRIEQEIRRLARNKEI